MLFKLFDDEGKQVPSGWSVTGARFEVEWPKGPSVVRSHFGARRFAYNWALGQVKADLDAKKQDPEHEPVPWTLGALRKKWDNQVKGEVAPWWAKNSKECYSAGIADLVKALSNWSSSRAGKRKGQKVGFPKFKSVPGGACGAPGSQKCTRKGAAHILGCSCRRPRRQYPLFRLPAAGEPTPQPPLAPPRPRPARRRPLPAEPDASPAPAGRARRQPGLRPP